MPGTLKPDNYARQTLERYTGSEIAEFGPYVLLVNFPRYIEDFARLEPIQSGVMDRLWYAFRREGISIPYPVRDLRHREALADEQAQRTAGQNAIRQLLGSVELFQSLSPEEMNRLAGAAKLKLFACGENLCRQGEAGPSDFLLQ